MANRINGNVIIVDSAMGNSFMLIPSNKNMAQYKIQAISFFSITTLGTVIITQANTSTDVVYASNIISVSAGTNEKTAMVNNPQQVTFPFGLFVSDLKVPTLSAGTAYIYLA